MGRPAKLTEELTSEITHYIQEGNSPAVSATLAGISRSTYFNWMSKGTNKEQGFLEFSESIERAVAKSVSLRVIEITTASKRGSWRASAWMLERLAPESFGKNRMRSPEVGDQRYESPQVVTLESLEQAVAKIHEIRSQQQSNSARIFLQPRETGENRDE
jgi:hypothetical protein